MCIKMYDYTINVLNGQNPTWPDVMCLDFWTIINGLR